MPTESSVLEALQPVHDPELNRSVVDLEMVKSVAVNDDLVRVTVAVPSSEYPLRGELREWLRSTELTPGEGEPRIRQIFGLASNETSGPGGPQEAQPT